MGVCVRNLDMRDSDRAKWLCRRMKEFKRGCKCGTVAVEAPPAPVVVSDTSSSSSEKDTHRSPPALPPPPPPMHVDCGTIHGLVQQHSSDHHRDSDDDHNDNNNKHKPIFGQTVELYRRAAQHTDDDDGGGGGGDTRKSNKQKKPKAGVRFEFVAHQASGVGGHYAFTALRPGVYDVRLLLTECWHAAPHEKSERIVTVECREESQRSKYLLDSTLIEHRDRNEAHLADSINFSLVHQCPTERPSVKKNRRPPPPRASSDAPESDDSERVVVIDDSIQWVREDKVPDKRALEDASERSGGGGGGGRHEHHGDHDGMGTGWKVFFFLVILLCACLYCCFLYRMTVDTDT
jgi:hypothetical protein